MESNLRFSHAGMIGDLLYSLNFAIELTIGRGQRQFDFIIQTNVPYKPSPLQLSSRSNKAVFFTKEDAQFIKPVLEAQLYINKVLIQDELPEDTIDLSMFRKAKMNLYGGDIRDWYFSLAPNFLHRQFWKQVIAVEPNDKFKDKILFTLSQRYVNELIDYKELEQFKDDLVFIGSEKEHKVFCQKYWGINYAGKMKNLLEISQLLAGAKGYVGNQTGIFALAEQMKINRVLMSADYLKLNGKLIPGPKNVLPLGGNSTVVSNTTNLVGTIKLLKGEQ